MSALGVYIPRVSTRHIGISLTRTAWVKLNRLRTGVGRFGPSMHKWGLASSAKYKCGASEQTADHIILTCPTHRAPRGIMGVVCNMFFDLFFAVVVVVDYVISERDVRTW